MKSSQMQSIKEHLESGNTLTALDALNLFGCLRLAARIADLKKLGLDIKTEMTTKNGKTFAVYGAVK